MSRPEAQARAADSPPRHDGRTHREPAAGGRGGAPAQIGRYVIEAELGRGGMGVVYRAFDPELARRVAIKMILEGGWVLTDEDVARFRREAQASARLDHPGIVRVHDVGQHERMPFIVMDLVEGSSLEAALEHDRMPPRRVAKLVREVALALQHAHDRGLVHRDVKPHNVLIDAEGAARLTDFGLARDEAASKQLTVTGDIIGTPAYMAPEQAEGRRDRQGALVDVYALGAVLYRALCGRPPFEGESALLVVQKVLTEEPLAPRALDPTIHPDLETIALKCLDKDPARRYASAGALAEDLQRFIDGEAIAARPPGRLERARRWMRRHALASALCASLAAAAVVALLAVVGWRRAARIEAEQARVSAERARRAEAAREALERLDAREISFGEALLWVVANAEPETVDALVGRLGRVVDEARESGFTFEERRASNARLCCNALGRIPLADGARATRVANVLARCLRVAEGELALDAFVALSRIDAPEAREAILAGWRSERFGRRFWERAARHIASTQPEPPDRGADPWDLAFAAIQLCGAGRWQQAERLLDAAVEAAPEDGRLRRERGWVRFELHDLRGAFEDHERAFVLSGKRSAEALVGRALARRWLGEVDAAVADTAHALALDPRSLLAREARADALFARATLMAESDPERELSRQEALRHVDAVLRIDPRSERALAARVYWHALESQKARRAEGQRGRAAARRDDEEGTAISSRLAESSAPQPWTLFLQAFLRVKLYGDFEGGVSDATRVLDMAPGFTPANLLRAEASFKLHAAGEASRSLGEILGDIRQAEQAGTYGPQIALMRAAVEAAVDEDSDWSAGVIALVGREGPGVAAMSLEQLPEDSPMTRWARLALVLAAADWWLERDNPNEGQARKHIGEAIERDADRVGWVLDRLERAGLGSARADRLRRACAKQAGR